MIKTQKQIENTRCIVTISDFWACMKNGYAVQNENLKECEMVKIEMTLVSKIASVNTRESSF